MINNTPQTSTEWLDKVSQEAKALTPDHSKEGIIKIGIIELIPYNRSETQKNIYRILKVTENPDGSFSPSTWQKIFSTILSIGGYPLYRIKEDFKRCRQATQEISRIEEDQKALKEFMEKHPNDPNIPKIKETMQKNKNVFRPIKFSSVVQLAFIVGLVASSILLGLGAILGSTQIIFTAGAVFLATTLPLIGKIGNYY